MGISVLYQVLEDCGSHPCGEYGPIWAFSDQGPVSHPAP